MRLVINIGNLEILSAVMWICCTLGQCVECINNKYIVTFVVWVITGMHPRSSMLLWYGQTQWHCMHGCGGIASINQCICWIFCRWHNHLPCSNTKEKWQQGRMIGAVFFWHFHFSVFLNVSGLYVALNLQNQSNSGIYMT